MWTPADYVLSGRFCDRESLRQGLDRLRLFLSAPVAVLLVCTQDVLFQSLMLASADVADEGSSLERKLLQKQFTLPGAGFGALLDLPGGQAVDASSFLSLLGKDSPLRVTSARLRAEGQLFLIAATAHRDDEPSSAGDRQWTQDAARVCLLFPSKRGANEADPDALRDLTTMANATAEVAVYRRYCRRMAIEQAITIPFPPERRGGQSGTKISNWGPFYRATLASEPERAAGRTTVDAWREESYRDVAHLVLDAALKVTASDIGGVFLSHASKSQLVVASSTAHPEGSLPETPEVVRWVLRLQRPLLVNDVTAFKESHPRTAKDLDRRIVRGCSQGFGTNANVTTFALCDNGDVHIAQRAPEVKVVVDTLDVAE